MKYLFIDTNIYKYLFSDNTTFSDDVVEIVKKLVDRDNLKLILPTQVIDEVERNYLENWYVNECDDKEKKKESKINDIEQKIVALVEYPKLKRILEKERDKYIKEHVKELKIVEEKYRNHKKSKAIKHFNSLKEKSEIINSGDVLSDAANRSQKNNPPYDKNKITDAIIWESVIKYFKKNNKTSVLYFLSDDKCYGQKGFNPFLQKEINAFKVKIHYRKSISSLRDLLGSDIDKIIEQESMELKRIAIQNFINSRSWASAGSNFNDLLKFKESLTLEDYKNIIKASTINDQIYRSFYVNISELLEDKNSKGFTLPILEEIDDTIWKSFKDRNLILINRRKDNVVISQD